jgi:hypothetical protein
VDVVVLRDHAGRVMSSGYGSMRTISLPNPSA